MNRGFLEIKHILFHYLKNIVYSVDVIWMKKVLFLVFYTFLFGASPFETKGESHFDLSVYETKATIENKKATNNSKIKCRWVCDKKIYTEQKIAEAVSFYKKSKDYNFTK